MAKVRVKAKPGRVARVSPRGEMIPDNAYMEVELTSYMRRLIHVHEDVEVEPKKAPAPKPEPKKPADSGDDKKEAK